MMSYMFARNLLQKTLSKQQQIVKLSYIKSLYQHMIDSELRVFERLDKNLQKAYNAREPLLLLVAKKMFNTNYDTVMVNCLRYVKDAVTYIPDHVSNNKVEYWNSPLNTMKYRNGDCEDINKLIAVLAHFAGVPEGYIWHCIGYVNIGGRKVGHYWLLYISKSDAKMYAIDGTYDVDIKRISGRKTFEISKERYTEILYIWNSNHIFQIKQR